MNRRSFFVSKSEKRNLNDCCGLPSQKMAIRCGAAKSKEPIAMLSLIGQGSACCSSILSESFLDSQK